MEANDENKTNAKNEATVKDVVEGLLQRQSGLVLTEGYATSVGHAVYNLHLSDMRAACASLCLRDRLRGNGSFAFREVAHGEAVDASDLPGTSDESRRVDVRFCEGDFGPDPKVERGSRPSVKECRCPMK